MSTTDDTAAGTTGGAHGTRGAARDAVDVQHDRFGGLKWGAAFFGWLTANGLAVILIAALTAAGVAVGLTNTESTGEAVDAAAEQASTIGLVGGIALLVVLFLAYLAGGYVAGRMARFDGAKQGVAVWIVSIVVIVVIAILAAVLGSQYNLFAQLNLPRIPIDEGTLTTGGIIALVAVALVTLLGAVLGGILGARWHRKVDNAGFAGV